MKSLLADVALPFAIVFLLLGLGALYMARAQDRHAQTLTRDGLLAVAQVKDKTVFTPTRSHKDGPSTETGIPTYTLHFRYVHPASGADVIGRADVAEAVWRTAQVGDHYQILVSPTDPALTSLFEGQEFVQGAQLAWTLCWALGGLGLLLLAAWRWVRAG